MFPETLIICINTHGVVPTDIENNISKPIIQTLKYPTNMIKINATTYGIPFVSSLDNAETIFSKLKETIDKLRLDILTPQQIGLIIKKQCELLNRENTKDIIKKSNYSNLFNLYANYSDFMFNIIETKIDEKYVEKIFIQFDDQKIKELQIGDSEYFNKIKILNLDNNNLFDMLKSIGHNCNQISLTDLIELLYNMTQMKNLIIVDITCSNTEDDLRNNRRIRRDLLNQVLI